MYNLHIYGGVKPKNLVIDLVIYSSPIYVLLNNEAYKKKYGIDNPNIEIIDAMKKAGIKIYTCRQTVSNFEIDPKEINSNVEVVLSRLTTVSTRQVKGYALFKF